MIKRLVARIVDAAGRMPFVVLFCVLAAAVGAWSWAAYKWELRSELLELLPRESPGFKAFEHQLGRTGGGAPLIVVNESPDRKANEKFIDDLTQHYSHGMRQRTVFAAALLHEPRVLIVDEPTVGLDPRSIRMLKDLLRQQAKGGTTVFLSTHSLDIAQELAERIGVVAQGKLIGCGTLDTLRRQAALDGSLEDVFLKLTEEPDPMEGE